MLSWYAVWLDKSKAELDSQLFCDSAQRATNEAYCTSEAKQ